MKDAILIAYLLWAIWLAVFFFGGAFLLGQQAQRSIPDWVGWTFLILMIFLLVPLGLLTAYMEPRKRTGTT